MYRKAPMAIERAVGHLAIDRCPTEHRARREEGRDDRGPGVRLDDDSDRQADRRGIHEEQTEGERRAHAPQPGLDPDREGDLADRQEQPVAIGEVQQGRVRLEEERDTGREEEPREHPQEGLAEERVLERGRRPDAELRWGRWSAVLVHCFTSGGWWDDAWEESSLPGRGTSGACRDRRSCFGLFRRPGEDPHAGPPDGSDTVAGGSPATDPAAWSVTARRSARRMIVRASSSAALVRVSPGTMNSRGISMRASVSARRSRWPGPWRRRPASRRRAGDPRRPAAVASSAAAMNSSRWRRRIDGPRAARPAGSVPAWASALSSARASPRAATASSIVP